MRNLLARKWPIFAVGLLVAAGAVVVCKTTPGCYLNGSTRGQTAILPSTSGEKNMPTTVQSQVQHADDASFRALVLDSKVPVLVDFYADWCRPCQRLAPVLEELAAETSGARIVKVNVEHSPALAAEYRIDAIPSLKVFRNGVVARQIAGLASKGELQELLAR
jgi:thioredoxin 1